MQPFCLSICAVASFLAGILFVSPARAQESFPLSFLRENCIEFTDINIGGESADARDCAVSEFDRFGVIGSEEYYYALYCLIPVYAEEGTTCSSDNFTANYHRARGLAIFLKDSAEQKPVLMLERATPEIGILIYERPQIIASPAGTLLVVPIRVDGTGSGNDSEYYLRQGADWVLLDARSWLDDLRQRIPKQYGLWHGIWPDLRTMTATTALYRADDANCCPTGGTVQMHLTIRDGRLVIRDLSMGTNPEGQ